MNTKYREALPHLRTSLSFKLEEISGTDLYYNDGDSRVVKSFFKLVLPKAVVYIYEGGYWLSFGSLTDAETLALRSWLDTRIQESK